MSKSIGSISVCMITTGFPVIPGDNSGVFIKKLVDNFGEKVNLKILVPSHKNDFMDFTNYKVIRVKYFFRRWENLFYSARGLPQEIKRNPLILWQLPFFLISMMLYALRYSKDADIIHAHWLPTGLFGILPKIIWGKPLIVTVLGSDVARMKKHWVDKLLAKVIFKFCDAVVVVSKSFEKQLRNKFPSLKVEYIPTGIDINPVNHNYKKSKSDFFEILYAGNLIEEKGILDLKWAFDQLILSGYKVRLTIVGNGDLKEMLEKWAAGHPDKITVKGTLPHDEVMSIMRISDVLVLPSYSEGRPNVVVEAMANYLPVIGTSIDGISELIVHEESGLLFSPGDKNALLNLLISCVGDKYPLKQFAEKAYEWIKDESYTWQKSAKANINLYNALHNI